MSRPERPELLHWGKGEEGDFPVFLFSIEDGATYWVIERNALAAVTLLAEQMEDEGFDEPDEFRSLKVKEVSADEAAGLTFIGESEERSFAEEFNRDPSPRLLACSEWP